MTIVATGRDLISVVEALYAAEPDDERWATGFLDAVRPVLLDTPLLSLCGLGHADAYQHPTPLLVAASDPVLLPMIRAASSELVDAPATFVRAAFYPGTPAITQREIERRLTPEGATIFASSRQRAGAEVVDGLGVFAYPRPGLAVVVSALYDKVVSLAPADRSVLSRLSGHLEAALRLRWCAEPVVAAVVSPTGSVLDMAHVGVERHRALLVSRVAAIDGARRGRPRRTLDGVATWHALVAGQYTVVPREDPDGKRFYLLLHNPPLAREHASLTPTEVDVLVHAARGSTGKVTAYTLGLSQSRVSGCLASAALKLGVGSKVELVRIAASLVVEPSARAPAAPLTPAEQDIFGLLLQGLSNAQIASLRDRSVLTVAKQVSSILRKSHSPSRRALAGLGLGASGTSREP